MAEWRREVIGIAEGSRVQAIVLWMINDKEGRWMLEDTVNQEPDPWEMLQRDFEVDVQGTGQRVDGMVATVSKDQWRGEGKWSSGGKKCLNPYNTCSILRL